MAATPHRPLGLQVGSYQMRPRDLIGEVTTSHAGNLVIRIGRENNESGGWEQRAHVVLTPDEAAELEYAVAHARQPKHERIEPQVWEQNPDRPEGYMRIARVKTVGEVHDEILAVVGEYPEGGEEYFSVAPLPRDTPWPDGRIVVFPVTGGSEGHYVHVEVHPVSTESPRQLIMLAKTFGDWDAAWSFAKRLGEILGV